MKSVSRTIVVCVSMVAAAVHVGCGGGGTQSPPPPMLKITTGALPNGITGNAYEQTIQAAGGVGRSNGPSARALYRITFLWDRAPRTRSPFRVRRMPGHKV